MYSLFVLLLSIVAILLIIIVLMQSAKGGGLSGSIGGGAAGGFGQAFGTRRTADMFSKMTWWLGGIIMAGAIFVNLFFLPGKSTMEQRESIIQSSQQAAPAEVNLPPALDNPVSEPVETDNNAD